MKLEKKKVKQAWKKFKNAHAKNEKEKRGEYIKIKKEYEERCKKKKAEWKSRQYQKEELKNGKAPGTFEPENEIWKYGSKEIKNGKAPGTDESENEIWKYGSKEIIEELTNIINEVWSERKIPEEWKTAVIKPILRKGDKNDIKNYRGIA